MTNKRKRSNSKKEKKTSKLRQTATKASEQAAMVMALAKSGKKTGTRVVECTHCNAEFHGKGCEKRMKTHEQNCLENQKKKRKRQKERKNETETGPSGSSLKRLKVVQMEETVVLSDDFVNVEFGIDVNVGIQVGNDNGVTSTTDDAAKYVEVGWTVIAINNKNVVEGNFLQLLQNEVTRLNAVPDEEEDVSLREKEISITFKRPLLTLKEMGLSSAWAINALAARRRRAIKFDVPGMLDFLLQEYPKKPRRLKAEVTKEMIERWPDWWNALKEDGEVDMQQLVTRVKGWFSAHHQTVKKAAQAAEAAAARGRGRGRGGRGRRGGRGGRGRGRGGRGRGRGGRGGRGRGRGTRGGGRGR